MSNVNRINLCIILELYHIKKTQSDILDLMAFLVPYLTISQVQFSKNIATFYCFYKVEF